MKRNTAQDKDMSMILLPACVLKTVKTLPHQRAVALDIKSALGQMSMSNFSCHKMEQTLAQDSLKMRKSAMS